MVHLTDMENSAENMAVNTPMSVDKIPAISEMTSQSMLDTPSYVSMYNHPGVTRQWRQKELCWLFNANLSMVFEKCPTALHCSQQIDSGKIVCFFMLIPSNLQFSLWEKICVGLLILPFRCGISVTSKILTVSDWYDQIEDSLVLDRPFLRLHRMVVDLNFQGQGIGSKCLGNALEDADIKQLPVVLGTQLLKNVHFYEKLGFKVVREEDFSPSGESCDQYHNWFMVRMPFNT